MIRFKGTTTDTGGEDQKRILQEVEKMNDSYVTVGLHSGAGQYPEGPEVAEVGLWNEFGTQHMPARSFLRSSIDDNQAEINSWRDEVCEKIMSGKMTVKEALNTIGTRLTFMIQNKIKSNVPPALAESTQAEKKREGVANVTLIDTGLMLRSVGYKVFLK